MNYLPMVDPEIKDLIAKEEQRQKETLSFIPSENYASQAVLEALGSGLTNKYSEGYPNKRYYQGQKYIDAIESLCLERAKALFNVPFANVQPYSGSPANAAVYFGLLAPGDTIMGLSLKSGGHLTHGVPNITFSGKFFQSVQYDVGEDGFLHYDEIEKLALKHKPRMIIAGITHYPRQLDFERFAAIARKVDAFLLADISHIVSLIIAGVHPSPFVQAHVVTPTTHKTLRGPRGAIIMVTQKGLEKDPLMGEKINKAVFPGLQGGPHDQVTAAIAVALQEASKPQFKRYGLQIAKNAKALADSLLCCGLKLMSDGTDNHVMVVDLRQQNILGNTVAEGLEEAGIVANRNAVPFDPNPPFYPSGLRLGTPAATSRGLGLKEMKLIGGWIADIVCDLSRVKHEMGIVFDQEKKRETRSIIIGKTRKINEIRPKVAKLCRAFPLKKQY